MFVLDSFTVPSGKLNTIIFANDADKNLQSAETPTTVTATDKDGNAHEDNVLLSMEYITDSGNVTWDYGTAQEFIAELSCGFDIRFFVKRPLQPLVIKRPPEPFDQPATESRMARSSSSDAPAVTESLKKNEIEMECFIQNILKNN